jgi:hypothetical protein
VANREDQEIADPAASDSVPDGRILNRMGNGEVKEREGDMMHASVGDPSQIVGKSRSDNGVDKSRDAEELSSVGRKIVRSFKACNVAVAEGFDFLLRSAFFCIGVHGFFDGDCKSDS